MAGAILLRTIVQGSFGVCDLLWFALTGERAGDAVGVAPVLSDAPLHEKEQTDHRSCQPRREWASALQGAGGSIAGGSIALDHNIGHQ